ncbi:MAG: glycogen debranching protein GlgX [Spirochaetes bacterium]|nr:glycogen debranching protein GlgX [Spirochaetota bacterium]
MPVKILLTRGDALLQGAAPVSGGVNFSIFSRNATRVFLCLYKHAHDAKPAFELALDPAVNRTGDVWHCHVDGIGPGSLYLWRIDGPFEPSEGHRFNVHRALLDPYAKALTDGSWNLFSALAYDPASPEADLSFSTARDDTGFPKCVVVNDDFDWHGDSTLNYPLKDCVIYETHVRGLTRSLLGFPNALGTMNLPRVDHPGTYRGVAEMTDYFKDLGITSLELLPIHEFDSIERFRRNPRTGELLSNYWGYSPLAFFAPKATYAYVDGEPHPEEDPSRQVREFKSMVRELHAAGIEVILDVVFNHTSEGNELGPTLSFRGIDNSIYYILDTDKRRYKNYSGCGNTLNCNHPVMLSLIRDCLRYWVAHMHVDGFRFDLGSILGRDSSGRLLENPPVIESIAEDPLLRDTKIIAEAWDAGGAYQVGSFPGGRWAEWNDKYRDEVRRFWKGEAGSAVHLATRITGSSDLYLRDGRKPFHSINFVTAHDGFTLDDLVSYSRKHNKENGEGNRDGSDVNWSSNFGVEGPSEDPFVKAKRIRQIKNFLATLLLSIGTPMLLGGDEIRRSQGGNNNAYCQDNATNWYDWSKAGTNAEILRFCRELIHFRMAHPSFRRPEFFTGQDKDSNDLPDITWFDEKGQAPDWTSLNLTLAALIDGSKAEYSGDVSDNDSYLMFNASPHPLNFVIPAHPRGIPWFEVIDTAALPPLDISPAAPWRDLARQDSLVLAPRSCVLLLAHLTDP